jgi:thiamine pyrophosphate-dependent acetolactate synthase large subunit-like protein
MNHPRTGRFAIIEQLLADGIQLMFGNPGTVEQGFLDAMGDYPDFRYITALQETVAVGIADGYARATGRPSVVQLHSGVGLGNGIGMLYQAKRGHTPLVVLAGESGLRYDAMEAQMWADLVAIATPVTKLATRVLDPGSVLRVLRRALKEAATPPMAPVFVSLPMDVLDAPNDEQIVPSNSLVTRVAPQPEVIREAAELLCSGSRPLIIAGDGVAQSRAQQELTRLAETLGAPVWGADWSELNMDYDHPQFAGLLGHMFGEDSRQITSVADATLICGTYAFPEVFPALSGAFRPGAPIVHIDLDAHQIGKNHPVTLGIVGDPKLTLAILADALTERLTDEQRVAAATRAQELGAAKRQALATQRERDRSFHDSLPIHASLFADELARQLPDDAIVFDEALTTSPELLRYWTPRTPGQYFLTRGGSLGVGIPGAIGLKMAHPDKVVVGFTGDGGAMYTIQALWTAARHQIGAKFVVCNNRSYELLKLNLREYWKERGIAEHAFPDSFDLTRPAIDFARLAESLGVPATRVEQPERIRPAIEQALMHPGPFLVDVVIANQVSSSREIPGATRA